MCVRAVRDLDNFIWQITSPPPLRTSRPYCLCCHHSSFRKTKTLFCSGSRRSLTTRSFGRTWCGGGKIGAGSLHRASTTRHCYSTRTDSIVVPLLSSSSHSGICSPLRSSFALHSHRTRGAVLPLITVRVVCHTCVHILRSLTLSELHLPASFSSSSSAFAALRISCQIQDTHNPTCRMLIGIPRHTVYTIYSSLQQST